MNALSLSKQKAGILPHQHGRRTTLMYTESAVERDSDESETTRSTYIFSCSAELARKYAALTFFCLPRRLSSDRRGRTFSFLLVLELQRHAHDAPAPDEPGSLSARAAELNLGRVVFLARLAPEGVHALGADDRDYGERGHDDHLIVPAL